MQRTRREAMRLGAAALAGIGTISVMPWRARAAGDVYKTQGGEIGIHPVSHASFVMTTPGPVIYVDPVGDPSAYADMPSPDVILITHEHGDHYAPETLAELAKSAGEIIVNPAVMEKLSEDLKAKATAVANGETADAGGIPLRAIPAYNTTEERLKYHPQGRDNGYVLEIDGKTVYIAGDTEDIPEMRALTGIDIAFVPMNLPYTMTEAQAASAVAEFKPAVVYPYHYRDSDLDKFEAALKEASGASQVVRGPWY
ncbi:MBL fold metallo-hydrolase [Albimonas sp. CAU 1670]|uniref:MBL fold metallo-hydrolase n=1 Tax=Albimonas sp. CAU 1670 TaxID=3032599 RepID=UPI0023DB30D4|nr:MBL fold metallo-hydrolase [Albimonas sp. CAU 1670]MDF2234499.1 MBL fold metallo-hydrolase [Albimonas sp. CAU 1670]